MVNQKKRKMLAEKTGNCLNVTLRKGWVGGGGGIS